MPNTALATALTPVVSGLLIQITGVLAQVQVARDLKQDLQDKQPDSGQYPDFQVSALVSRFSRGMDIVQASGIMVAIGPLILHFCQSHLNSEIAIPLIAAGSIAIYISVIFVSRTAFGHKEIGPLSWFTIAVMFSYAVAIAVVVIRLN
ncbi:hypothetical protein [Tsukamurella tyrosinosolvens]|uniref:hypothetical protein n=1 Tax=Tsukamurella tyrosinosolvens TaxID=57704 RepID=UPI000794154A|nr:hypothetical protein [Tsukamurella tyrosinosolvens]KXP04858.1 hypothetical protein AXK59_15965 [Tsukamurella tyrosinosolvens]